MAIGGKSKGTGPWLPLGAAMAIAMTAGCTQPELEPTLRLGGSGTELGNVMGVLVSPDRKPAAGIEVMLYPLDTAATQDQILRTTTGEDGVFSFQVEGGLFRLLSLDGAGNGATVDSLLPSPVDTLDLQEVGLEPLGGIRGYVKSAPTGSTLRLIGTPFDTAFATDAEFVWEGIPAGSYWLEASQSVGMVAHNSSRLVVSVAPGTVTELPDTLDLSTRFLELQPADLPYRLVEPARPMKDITPDSGFWMLNGKRFENESNSVLMSVFTLSEALIDSARANFVELFVHSGDSLILARRWNITLNRDLPVNWAYQAVQAVLIATEPDRRPRAPRLEQRGTNPQLGTFRVLQSRLLAPEELEYWEWPAANGGGGVSAPDSFQAAIYHSFSTLRRGCKDRPALGPNFSYLPGDTVTFFLLPDSILGAVAFRLRNDERFQDMDRLGYFARADWPIGTSFHVVRKQMEWITALRPEGLQIDWPWILSFRESPQSCQSTYRRFLVDSTGRVREIVATPPGIDPARILLHFRAEFTEGIDADTLPTSGSFVYIDSAGFGVAGTPDSSRQFQLEAGVLEELKNLLAALHAPTPAAWHQEYISTFRQEGPKEALRYLVSDQNGVLHITGHPDAAPGKADLFSRVEDWLRERNLL